MEPKGRGVREGGIIACYLNRVREPFTDGLIWFINKNSFLNAQFKSKEITSVGFFVDGGYFFPAKEGQNDKLEFLNSFCVRPLLLKAAFPWGIYLSGWWHIHQELTGSEQDIGWDRFAGNNMETFHVIWKHSVSQVRRFKDFKVSKWSSSLWWKSDTSGKPHFSIMTCYSWFEGLNEEQSHVEFSSLQHFFKSYRLQVSI